MDSKILSWIKRLLGFCTTLLTGFVFLWLYIITFVPVSRTKNWNSWGILIIILPASYVIGLFIKELYKRIKKT